MTREEQDKRWNDLSEEKQKSAREMYKQITKPLNPAKSNVQNESDVMSFALETTFGSHNLNPKSLTYDMIAMEMYREERLGINGLHLSVFSEEQANKLSAIHKLITVAKYLNGDWRPDWSDDECKWALGIDPDINKVRVIKVSSHNINTFIIYFHTEELAEQAVQILGEETIRLALFN